MGEQLKINDTEKPPSIESVQKQADDYFNQLRFVNFTFHQENLSPEQEFNKRRICLELSIPNGFCVCCYMKDGTAIHKSHVDEEKRVTRLSYFETSPMPVHMFQAIYKNDKDSLLLFQRDERHELEWCGLLEIDSMEQIDNIGIQARAER